MAAPDFVDSDQPPLNQLPAHNQNVDAEKANLRREVLARRSRLDADVRTELSRRATEWFLKNVPFAERAMVALYWPIRDELDCRILISELQNRGHQTCLPVVVGADLPLQFRAWDGRSQLQSAAFGTQVPGEDSEVVIPDMIVMPLAGFDGDGNRLGYGKGFYDRTIAIYASKPLLVGLAFAAQELENIPASPHDVPLDMVVTETGVQNLFFRR